MASIDVASEPVPLVDTPCEFEGRLRYANGLWCIESTPDVTMRIKRVFPRLEQAKSTRLILKATDEVAADLEWILSRWPLDMDLEDASFLAARAQAYRDKQHHLRLIRESRSEPREYSLALPLRDYQRMATDLYLAQGFLLNADVVGLGKTATAIASFTDKRTLPALVVVKAHLPGQWVDEIRKFLPDASVHVVKTMKEYDLPPADVYVISYNKLAKWWGVFARLVKSVVYDEMQELRLPTSNKYDAARLLNSEVPFKLGLSATPVCNYGGEIWNVLSLLSADALGSHSEFIREWCIYGPGGKAVVQNPDALGNHLRRHSLMIRRTRKEAGRLLPPVVRYVQDVNFDRDVFARSTGAADELARIILSGTFLERGQAARQFDLELRQATGVAKAPFVAELIRMLVDSGEKVLVSGWHRSVYAIWMERLRDLRPCLYTGTESPTQKDEARRRFIEGETDVMLMSLRSGAGLNGLQDVCSCCVLGELDWSPAVHEQFIGRLARDGQKESVQVFIPVAPVGSDPTMASVLGLKQAQAEGIVDLGINETPDFVETDMKRISQLAQDYLEARKIRA